MTGSNQEQGSGKNSLNIQVGRDFIVGVSTGEARQIADDVFKVNFLQLQGEARIIGQERVKELIEEFFIKFKKEDPALLGVFKDPNMQYALFTAQRDYALSGNEDLRALLVNILIDRTKMNDHNLKKIVLNEAIQVASKLTSKQLDAITLRFLITYCLNAGINSVNSFNQYLKSHLIPFCSDLTFENSDYQHIDYLRCGSIGVITKNMHSFLINNYAGVLSVGFNDEVVNSLALTEQQYQKLVIPCFRNEKKLQICALNDSALDYMANQCELDKEKSAQVKKMQKEHLLTKEDLVQQLFLISPRLSQLSEIWDNTSLGTLQLTTVGIALAHAHIKKILNIELDLGDWIK